MSDLKPICSEFVRGILVGAAAADLDLWGFCVTDQRASAGRESAKPARPA
jgi:hypothetical protein